MSSKCKLVLLMVVVSLLVVGCGNDTNDVPDVGEETLDELVEDTVDVVEDGVSLACTLCLAVESAENCTGVCQ